MRQGPVLLLFCDVLSLWMQLSFLIEHLKRSHRCFLWSSSTALIILLSSFIARSLSANNTLVEDKEGRYTPSIQTLTLERNRLKWLTPPHLSICISAVFNSAEVGKWFLSYSPMWTLSGMTAEALKNSWVQIFPWEVSGRSSDCFELCCSFETVPSTACVTDPGCVCLYFEEDFKSGKFHGAAGAGC